MLKYIKFFCKAILPYGLVRIWQKYICTEASTIRPKEVTAWFNDNGDKTLRLNYPLCSESIVFDLGGYEGEWAKNVYAKYSCFLFIFEPINIFASVINDVFSNNKKITIINSALGSKNCTETISIDKDSSSLFCEFGTQIGIKVIKLSEYINENNIKHIDLIKINVEGAEYDIINDLSNAGLLNRFDFIQVQFHNFVDGAEEKLAEARKKLALHHKQDWCYEFVWEGWSLK